MNSAYWTAWFAVDMVVMAAAAIAAVFGCCLWNDEGRDSRRQLAIVIACVLVAICALLVMPSIAGRQHDAYERQRMEQRP